MAERLASRPRTVDDKPAVSVIGVGRGHLHGLVNCIRKKSLHFRAAAQLISQKFGPVGHRAMDAAGWTHDPGVIHGRSVDRRGNSAGQMWPRLIDLADRPDA